MALTKVRAYICDVCREPKMTPAGQRGPLPLVCPEHRTPGGKRVVLDKPPPPSGPGPAGGRPPAAVLIADPFNSTPVTAPVPPRPVVVQPSAVHDPGPSSGPGPIELQLTADLEHVETNNPLAKTLAQVAIRCARAADLAPADDLKSVLAAVKELRAIMAEISKSHSGGGEDDGFDDTPVGSSRPEIRNSPTF